MPRGTSLKFALGNMEPTFPEKTTKTRQSKICLARSEPDRFSGIEVSPGGMEATFNIARPGDPRRRINGLGRQAVDHELGVTTLTLPENSSSQRRFKEQTISRQKALQQVHGAATPQHPRAAAICTIWARR
ncbi:hypothetical protein B7W85_10430 [Allorhizobium ampelinum]|nr:hypothetical protein B7W85_10430 [Allorhizobium ampelinum]